MFQYTYISRSLYKLKKVNLLFNKKNFYLLLILIYSKRNNKI